jgi:hypothetical protein
MSDTTCLQIQYSISPLAEGDDNTRRQFMTSSVNPVKESLKTAIKGQRGPFRLITLRDRNPEFYQNLKTWEA